MTFTRWLRDLQSRCRLRRPSGNGRRHALEARTRFRPRLEALEGRLAPATLIVNTALDENAPDNVLSLREAIRAVNIHSTGELSTAERAQVTGTLGVNDTITFAGSLIGQTITLGGFELFTSSNLSIIGPGAGNLKISGNNASRILEIGSATVSLSGLTIANGNTSGDVTIRSGGGIRIDRGGTLSVTDCTFDHNTTPAAGGAIVIDQGSLTVTNTTFSSNSAFQGGGIWNGGGSLTVTNSTFSGNFTTGFGGGGIFNNQGSLKVTNSTFFSNRATGGAGGGISSLSGADLTVTNSTFSSNSAFDFGGGIFNTGGPLTLTNTTLSGNHAEVGGGIANDNFNGIGTATVANSTLSGNYIFGGDLLISGGGIFNRGSLTLTNSTLSGNYTTKAGFFLGGGGIDNFGTVKVSNSTLSDNYVPSDGGGILNHAGATVVLTNSYLRHNHAGSGGGIVNGGTLTVTGSTFADNFTTAATGYGGAINNYSGTLAVANSTFFNNTATYSGGAINNQAPLTLTNSTLAGNTSSSFGGGLTDFVAATIGNTIIAKNTAPNGPDVDLAVASQGYNLIGNPSGGSGFVATDMLGTAASPLNPLLGPLQDNGGPLAGAPASQQVVPTLALLPGSPAIDAGSNALAVDSSGIPLAIDQRGFARVVNSSVDIGAFEVQLYLVYSTADSGGGSLRTALINANRAGGSVIAFTTGGTISLASALPDISRSVQILGPGANNLTVQRSTALGTPAFRIFTVDAPTGGIKDVTVALAGLTIANGNTASSGGGIDNSATLTVSNCTLSGNSTSNGDGGGIENELSGRLTVINSTFSGNTALAIGGGVGNLGTLTVTNSTFTRNSAGGGGGIENDLSGTLTLTNSTLSGNSALVGGGIEIASGTVTVANTILAGNTASVTGPDVFGTVSSRGYNLVGDGSGSSGFNAAGDKVGTHSSPINPLLAPLGNYGGPTQTMALLPGSPAIRAGNPNATGLPATDQRGFARIVNGFMDIGAFESRGFTLSVAGGNNQQTTVNTPFAATLRMAVSSAFGEPVQGGVVTFSAPSSGASATFPNGNTATIDATGQASIAVNANTIAGSYTVTASAAGAAAVIFTLTNAPGAATKFVITAPASVNAGSPFSITVTALDAYGNVATGYRGTVKFSSSDNGAALPGKYTFTAADAGVHTFTGLILRKKGTTQTIKVFDDDNNNILGTVSIEVL
jgi:hypothetical protein